MSRNGLGPVGLDKLEAALDTYGADRTRWPAPLRLSLSGLIAANPDAQKMLQDAVAFDRLLDSAPQYDMARLDGLSNRIAAAVEHQPRIVSRNASAPSTKFKSGWLPLRRYNGFAATALAASLMLGVFAGQLNMFNSAADVLLSGGDLGTQVSAKQMAQTDDAEGLMDEDLL
jgi:hypothetical protein